MRTIVLMRRGTDNPSIHRSASGSSALPEPRPDAHPPPPAAFASGLRIASCEFRSRPPEYVFQVWLLLRIKTPHE